jgi:hypothetical protein
VFAFVGTWHNGNKALARTHLGEVDNSNHDGLLLAYPVKGNRETAVKRNQQKHHVVSAGTPGGGASVSAEQRMAELDQAWTAAQAEASQTKLTRDNAIREFLDAQGCDPTLAFEDPTTGRPIVPEGLGPRAAQQFHEMLDQRDEAVRRVLEQHGFGHRDPGTGQTPFPSGQPEVKGAESDPSPTEDSLSLKEFIEQCCQPLATGRAGQLASCLLKKAGRIKPHITLPPTTNQAERNHKKFFRPSDLRKRWADYQKFVPNLPDLK